MKILYAALAAGNGHLSRAEELIPIIEQFGQVDLAISGTDAQVQLAEEVSYKSHGIIFHLGKRGGINYWRTIKDLRLASLYKDIRDFPIKNYDLVINDFEPVTARAAKLKNIPIISVSHQASFLSENTPRPDKRIVNLPAEMILKYYANCKKKIGLHFQAYDEFIRTPVIKSKIRKLYNYNAGHYVVYLPAYEDFYLANILSQIDSKEWIIFSKRSPFEWRAKNCLVKPISINSYTEALASCEGLLTGGGFEAPAEAMYLGKKLLMIPQKGQYEQQANATAAAKLGVKVLKDLKSESLTEIENWVFNDQAIQIDFPDNAYSLIEEAVGLCAG